MSRSLRFAALGACLLAAACGGKQPGGQVVATVNGEEITRQELNAMISGAQLPKGADRKVVQAAALDQLVNQRLIIQDAKEQGLDKTPQYLAATRRANDALLAQAMGQKLVQSIRAPFGSAVDAYIAANPTRFEQRELIGVDQIRTSVQGVTAPGIREAHSLAAVAAALQAAKLPIERGRSAIDTATVTPELMKALNSLPPGEPFAVPQGNAAIFNVVVARRPAPLAGDEARRAATAIMRRQAADEAVQKKLAALKKDAKVQYQPGFAPPPQRAPAKAG